MIRGVLFEGGSIRSKMTKLEALTEVKERFIMSQRFICGQDPETLSKKEEGSDCQRSWSSALKQDNSLSRQSAGKS